MDGGWRERSRPANDNFKRILEGERLKKNDVRFDYNRRVHFARKLWQVRSFVLLVVRET